MPKARTFPRRAFEPQTVTAQRPDAPTFGPPARQSTLYAMPTHLIPSSSSSSYSPPQMSSPVMVPVQMAAPQSLGRKSTAPFQRSNSLHRAVTGLGNLMEEAINVARDAAEKGRNEEVANILDNATVALRHASIAQDRLNAGRMSSPLVLSPPNSGRHERTDTDSSIAPDSDASSIRSEAHTVATAPTMLTRSAHSSLQPMVEGQHKPGRVPTAKISPRASTLPPRRHSTDSISRTPPRLYQPPSADSIVRDFAYAREKTAKAEAARALSKQYGSASGYYGDHGESVKSQPGIRPSISAPMITDKPLPELPGRRGTMCHRRRRRRNFPIHYLEPIPIDSDPPVPPRKISRQFATSRGIVEESSERRRSKQPRPAHVESVYHHAQPPTRSKTMPPVQEKGPTEPERTESGMITDTRYGNPSNQSNRASVSKSETARYSAGPSNLLHRNVSLKHPRRKHISLREGQGFSLGRFHRRQPIAREWSTHRKRITATIACLNTVFIGLITGIYVSVISATDSGTY